MEAGIIVEEYEAKYGTKDGRPNLLLDKNKEYIEHHRNQLLNFAYLGYYEEKLAKLEALKEERQKSLVALTQIWQTDEE